MVTLDIAVKIAPTHLQFYIQQLRKSGFQDPVTAEQNSYNEFVKSVMNELAGAIDYFRGFYKECK
jgi:hypothetical protein